MRANRCLASNGIVNLITLGRRSVRTRLLEHCAARDHFAGAGAPGAASAALRPLWPRNIRVGENSPSLCPTMSSCTNTLRNLFPLWTSNVWPTNSGMIVHARAQVLIGCLARFSFSFATFLKASRRRTDLFLRFCS